MFGRDLTDQAQAGNVAAMVAKTIYPSHLPLLAIGLMAWIESRAIGPTLFFEASEVPGKQSADASISGDNIVGILGVLESENLIRYRESGDSFSVAIMSEVQKMDLDLIRQCLEPEKGNRESVIEHTKGGFFVSSKPKTSTPIALKSEPEKAVNAQIIPENSPIRGGGLGGVSESGEASEAASYSKPASKDPEIRKPPKRAKARKAYKLTDEGKAYADSLKSKKTAGERTDQVEQICDWIGEFRAGVLKSAGVKKIHPAKWTPKSRRAIDVLLKAGYDIDDFKAAWTAQSNSDLKDRDPKKWKLFFTHSTIHREKNFARLIDSSGDIDGDASKAGESSWTRSSEPDPTDSMDQVPF
jgi:DNA-binding PadR family transcriptional regulator